MPKPDGGLTESQLEILDAIWSGPPTGSTVTEIWEAITRRRKVTRTTVLNQVDRLEKRGWLRRKKHDDGFRYLAAFSREIATRGLAEQFLDSFFGGSASELVMSLLGSKKLSASEVQRLRELLPPGESNTKPKQ
jgi:BlaI family transcriptional regulator, penicillinase repressor